MFAKVEVNVCEPHRKLCSASLNLSSTMLNINFSVVRETIEWGVTNKYKGKRVCRTDV